MTAEAVSQRRLQRCWERQRRNAGDQFQERRRQRQFQIARRYNTPQSVSGKGGEDDSDRHMGQPQHWRGIIPATDGGYDLLAKGEDAIILKTINLSCHYTQSISLQIISCFAPSFPYRMPYANHLSTCLTRDTTVRALLC